MFILGSYDCIIGYNLTTMDEIFLIEIGLDGTNELIYKFDYDEISDILTGSSTGGSTVFMNLGKR